MQQEITTTNQDIAAPNAQSVTSNAFEWLRDKKQIATMLNCCVRQVDNYLAQGMPHYKPTPRKVQFDPQEVKAWYCNRFAQQRRKF